MVLQSANTDCNTMKRITTTFTTRALSCLALAYMLEACTFNPMENEFKETIWTSSQFPLGPFDIESISLEFRDGNEVIIYDGSQSVISRGTYETYGCDVVLNDLTADTNGTRITFTEAHLSRNTLFLLWRPESMLYPFTTSLKRKPLRP